MYRECASVPEKNDEYNSISLHIIPQGVWVEGELASTDLGFKHEKALRDSQAFVEILYEISQKVDRLLLEVCPRDEPDIAGLDRALHLSDDTWWSALVSLMKIGAGLRTKLAPGILEKLDYHDFRFRGEEVPEEMVLTFKESKETPILWEMFYESENEVSSSPVWHRFWGFGVPITHWTETSRKPTIRLRNGLSGLFSAIHEGLPFAQLEEQALKECLQQQLQRRLSYYSLKQELHEYVHQAMMSKLCNEDLEAWWENCSDDIWLQRFLEEMAANDEKRLRIVQTWKDDTLLAICRRCFTQELIHFACHCESSKYSDFLSRLIMKVAGEEISLDVSTMVTKLRRDKYYFSDPGSLVFLNACGTGQPLATEPPGFPDTWINYQRAVAIVATICPVPDYFAHAFALKFYEILFASKDSSPSDMSSKEAPDSNATMSLGQYFIADALLKTRRYFMQHYNNPLGLAYILYAVKDAHVQVDPMQEEGGRKWP